MFFLILVIFFFFFFFFSKGDLVTFWVAVDEFEKSDSAKRKVLAEAIIAKISSSEVLMKECDLPRRQAAEQMFNAGANLPENMFESMKLDVEDSLDQNLMPSFLMMQKVEKLSSSASNKPPSIRGKSPLTLRSSARDLAANMETQNTIAALKSELHDCKG